MTDLERQSLKSLISDWFRSWWIRNYKYALKNRNRNPPILIYQMGKVGSSTVAASLKALSIPNPIYHVHFLNDERLAMVEADIARLKREQTQSDFINHLRRSIVHEHYIASRAVKRRLARRQDHFWSIITLIRDPIARRVSEFFETMWNFHPELIDSQGNVLISKTLSYLKNELEERGGKVGEECGTWFDVELKTVFGIDVFAQPFDQADGHTIIELGGTRTLILTLEHLNQNSEVIAQFVGWNQPISLVKANMSSTKRNAEAYHAIRRDLRVSREICTQIYTSRFVEHFYSPEMREAFARRWSTSGN